MGILLFQILAWTAFALCLLEGIRVTSDAISEEKREGTLGLLFLTDLRSEEIVLGKQAGVSLNSLYSLMAVVPALGVPLLLGGVTAGEFWRLVLSLFVSLFLSLAVGTVVSVVSESMIAAYSRSFALLLLFGVLLPLADLALKEAGMDLGLSVITPTGMLMTLGGDVYEVHPGLYWGSLAFTMSSGLVLLVIACRALPYFWNRSGERAAETTRRISTQSATSLVAPVETDPMGWLATSQSWRLRVLPRVAMVIGVVLITTATLAPPNLAFGIALAVGTLLTHWILNLWQGLNAVSVGALLRSTGFIELLFISPMSVQELVLGMGRGTARYCARATAVLGGMEFLSALVFGLRWIAAIPGDVGSVIFVIFVTGFVLMSLHIDLWAASWMGLYQGIVQRKRATAMLLTVVWVQLLPMALYLLCFWLGPLFGIIKSVVVMLWARDRLLFEFPRLVRAHHLPVVPQPRKVLTGLMDSPPLPDVEPRSDGSETR